MKIQVWELRLYYNLCDLFSDNYVKILEFYIPELGYSVNYYEKNVNVIKADLKRYSNVNIFFEIVRTKIIKEYEANKEEEKMFKSMIMKNL